MDAVFIVNHVAFIMGSGALQGCPLSGFIFATSTSPFMSYIEIEIDGKSNTVTRICADDVGSALDTLWILR